MSGYDRALTVFSPDGHLFQVEYAQEAVKKGTATVGIRAKDCIVLAIENKVVNELQENSSVQKICQVDEHIYVAFAGLLADARILIDMARLECQNHQLSYDEPPTVSSVTKFIARTQQKHTQRGGMRPFGVSAIFAGFNGDGFPHLYLTEPGGVTMEWMACAIGRGEKNVREYLEKNYKKDMEDDEAVNLAIRALLEILEPNRKFFEVFVIPKKVSEAHFLTSEVLEERIRKADEARTAKEETQMSNSTLG